MRLFRLLTGSVLLSAIVFTMVWLSPPWWLGKIAIHELEELGFHEISLSIDQIGFHESRISYLHLKQAEGIVEVEASNARISYSILKLFKQQIDGIKLENLEISLHPSKQLQAEHGLILLSPVALFSLLPADNIDIEQMTLRQLDHNKQPVQEISGSGKYSGKTLSVMMGETDKLTGLQAVAILDEHGECRASLNKGKLEIIRATCLITQQSSELSIECDMHADLAALDTLLTSWVELPKHRIKGELQLKWSASLPTTTDSQNLQQQLRFNTDLALNTTLEGNAWPLQLSLKSSLKYNRGQGSWKLANGSSLYFGSNPGSQLSLADFSGTFSLKDDEQHLSLAKHSSLQLDNLHGNDISISHLKFKLEEPLHLKLADDLSLYLNQTARLSIDADKLRWKQNSIRTQNISITLNRGNLIAPAGNIAVRGFTLASPALNIPLSTLSADFNLGSAVTTARGFASTSDSTLHIDWNLKHIVEKDSGQLNFSFKPVALPSPDLMQLFNSDNNTLDLQAGSLNANGILKWGRDRVLNSHSIIKVENMNGSYRETTFSGFNTELELATDKHGLNISSNRLQAHTLDAGLPLSKISMAANINHPFQGSSKTVITRLRAEALGGLISSERIDIDTAKSSNPFLVRLEHIDARQLAELRKQEGFTAAGKLDGSLPFDWTDKGLKMTTGKLKARAPGGLIRYLGTASIQQLAKTDTATRMAMQILSDFRFKLLHIGIDYQPDGQMALKIELKGNNPDYENGRPVEFNFNIEENVLKLLQSLRMADEISQRLEKKVQKKMQKE